MPENTQFMDHPIPIDPAWIGFAMGRVLCAMRSDPSDQRISAQHECFFMKHPLAMEVDKYAEELQRLMKDVLPGLGSGVPLVSLVFLIRFLRNTGLQLTQNIAHKLLFACFHLAALFSEDCPYKKRRWAEMSRLSNVIVNQFNVVLLKGLEWNLCVSKTDASEVMYILHAHSTPISLPLSSLDKEEKDKQTYSHCIVVH